MVDHSENWAYEESFLWGNIYPQCNSLKQSPVNIDTSDIKECRTLCQMKHKYKESKCFLTHKNKTISIKYGPGSYTEYKGTLYELTEISIHTPSLHSIDNQKFDLEICLVHKLTDNSNEGSGVMICCMFESNTGHFGKPDQFISQIINHIPIDPINYDKEIMVSNDWSAAWIPPENSGYFSYEGSLPYPPCQEGYTVFVYEKIGTIGSTHIDIFKRYIDNNTRSVRQLGTRTIFYTPFLKSGLSYNKVFRSSNKYLKCYPERALKKTVPTEPTTTKLVSNDGLSVKTKNSIKNIFLSIIILLIMVNAFYFTKFLFRHFYVQKMLRMFAGYENIGNDSIKSWRSCTGGIITSDMKIQKAKIESGNNSNDYGELLSRQQQQQYDTSSYNTSRRSHLNISSTIPRHRPNVRGSTTYAL